MFGNWTGQCGRLIPQWSQDCLEACCVWSLSGHFNISPRSWIGPHVAEAITRGSPSSFVLPPSAGLPHPAAAVCHFVVSTKLLSASHIPLLSLCFLFLQHISFTPQTWLKLNTKYHNNLHRCHLLHLRNNVFTDLSVLTLNPESIISFFRFFDLLSLNSVFTLSLICQ